MPLPWGPAGPRTRIPEVAERAITIKQLRELRTFIKRLTKTDLLKNTSEHSKQEGTYGQPILWKSINSYQITDEVIKKVIPFVDPDGERDPAPVGSKRRWYSWVEFVAAKPQPAKIMFSHWWGGRFMDFMAAVDKLAVDRSLSINTAIWVCTFANCQFGEDFGAMLKECPFIRTLRTVELTVLIVDFKAGSLSRSWCGLEVHYTTEQEMELVLYTSAGRVGSSYVSGGPLVEAIKCWDIRQSEASDPPYRRQILNYVAGVGELEGLKKDAAGKLEADSLGRPQLQDGREEKRDPGAVGRITGEEEYAYESALFRRCSKSFEDLNMAVRLSVMSNIGVNRKAKGCAGKVPSQASRGVTLSQLRVISKKLEATCPWTPSRTPWWQHGNSYWDALDSIPYASLNGYMMLEWILHMTASEECTMMELIADGPQVPQFMLEHAWIQPWSEKMYALELFAEAQHLPDSTVFWVDWLSRNQYEQHRETRNEGSPIDECAGVLCIVPNDQERMARLWQWYTLTLAVQSGKSVFLATKEGVMACNQPFASGGWVCGTFDAKTASMLAGLDLREMQCSDPHDRTAIMSWFHEASIGPAGSVEDSIARFHARLRCFCAGPILRSAAKVNDAALISSVCTWPGLRLNSDTLKSGQGETPIHIAAACGSMDALRALLMAGMDPDIEDDIKERPLHYAALAGHANVVQELLAVRADPWAESSFAETPLEVAKQNPAAFLNVDTQAVVGLLSAAGTPSETPGTGSIRGAVGSAVSAIRTLTGCTAPQSVER